MELAVEILNKEIERREILLAVETNVLIQNDMHNEIGGLKDVVKKLTIADVSVPKGALVCENCTHFEVCNKQHRTVETCGYYKE